MAALDVQVALIEAQQFGRPLHLRLVGLAIDRRRLQPNFEGLLCWLAMDAIKDRLAGIGNHIQAQMARSSGTHECIGGGSIDGRERVGCFITKVDAQAR